MPSHDHTKVHHNATAFQPNRGKKVADKIKSALEQAVAASAAGCCGRCADQVRWKQKYGKFRALTEARKWCVASSLLYIRCYRALCSPPLTPRMFCSNACAKHTVKAAYHNLCRDCARAKGVCPKCQSTPPSADQAAPGTGEAAAEALAEQLSRLRERERRAAQRALERGMPLPERLGLGAPQVGAGASAPREASTAGEESDIGSSDLDEDDDE